jgi:hypothetical protein
MSDRRGDPGSCTPPAVKGPRAVAYMGSRDVAGYEPMCSAGTVPSLPAW